MAQCKGGFTWSLFDLEYHFHPSDTCITLLKQAQYYHLQFMYTFCEMTTHIREEMGFYVPVTHQEAPPNPKGEEVS